MTAIDAGNCLVTLTGGFLLRLNPTLENHGETILNYLGECKKNNLFVGIAGCELTNVILILIIFFGW